MIEHHAFIQTISLPYDIDPPVAPTVCPAGIPRFGFKDLSVVDDRTLSQYQAAAAACSYMWSSTTLKARLYLDATIARAITGAADEPVADAAPPPLPAEEFEVEGRAEKLPLPLLVTVAYPFWRAYSSLA